MKRVSRISFSKKKLWKTVAYRNSLKKTLTMFDIMITFGPRKGITSTTLKRPRNAIQIPATINRRATECTCRMQKTSNLEDLLLSIVCGEGFRGKQGGLSMTGDGQGHCKMRTSEGNQDTNVGRKKRKGGRGGGLRSKRRSLFRAEHAKLLFIAGLIAAPRFSSDCSH